MLAGALAAVGMMLLAGCTGNFDVQQTEPFRVRLEGDPQTVTVNDDDGGAKEVLIATCDDPCADGDEDQDVNVKVQVKQVSGPCTVLVTIKNKATGQVIEQREVSVGGSTSQTQTQTSTASGNQTNGTTTTVTQTQTETQGGDTTVVVQNFFVSVKGKDNIVVLTQAIDGQANVDISAAKATGNANASVDGDADGATSSTTMTTASSGNTTSP